MTTTVSGISATSATVSVVFGSGGAGATGGGPDQAFYLNDTHITTDFAIPAGKNAMSAGPITIDVGAAVTVPSGSVWTII